MTDEDDDALLERIKEESLKHFQENGVSKDNVISRQGVLPNNVSSYEESQVSRPIWFEGKEAEGFYLAAGSSYIYPTNYPVREYQENIVRTALFKNTLVSLPTGLGKTFIAAVVMYNYYRWYPKGKIVFMAPTRPLVSQQIKACYNIMGLPIEDTTEMTGNLNVQDRVKLWQKKRVFFLTPQVMVNDIRSKSCPAKLIKCLVVDEAHRAVKDYAYCQVVTLLEEQEVIYRVLALSATPGNDVIGVQQIIQNLKISSLEFRGEDALDVIKYTHQKKVESIVVNLSINIQRVKGDFLKVYDKYAKNLRECKAMNCNISTVTKFQVLKASEKFQARPPRGLTTTAVGRIICDFSVCMSLAHALELLQIYGLRAFYSYLSEGGDKNKAAATRLRNDTDLSKILGRLKQMLAKKPEEEGYIWGHSKLHKLTLVLSHHFKTAKDSSEKTKAIIFCQYRVVVNEIFEILRSVNSDIKPVMFIGQSSNAKDRGMTQAKQLEIMKNFRAGIYNCMIATCVAEEGLDIGEVDLIVLMEAHKSPIRLVQRIGRTGRKRNGKCIVLVTEGREEYKFKEAMIARKSYVSGVLNAKSVKEKLYPKCPSMFPPGVKPTRQLLHIEVVELTSPEKQASSKQVDIRSCLVPEESPFLTSDQYCQVTREIKRSTVNFDSIPKSNFLFHRSDDPRMSIDELLKKDFTVFSDWNYWNLQLHEIHELSHSSESKMMCSLLNRFYSFDVKFFNLSKEKKKRKRIENLSDCEDDQFSNNKGKKTKKEINSCNLGMDIRLCVAGMKDKAKVPRHFDPDEIIEVDAIAGLKNVDSNSDAALIDEVIQSLEKDVKLKNVMPVTTNRFDSFEDDVIKAVETYGISPEKNDTSILVSLFGRINRKQNFVSELISDLNSVKLETAKEKDVTEVGQLLDSAPLEQLQSSITSIVELDDLLNENNLMGDDKSQKPFNNAILEPFNDLNREKVICSQAEETEGLWESIPDDFFNSKITRTPNSSRYLAASTPKNSKFIDTKKTSGDINLWNEIESPIPKNKTYDKDDDDVWNLDDLFEGNNEPKDTNIIANENGSRTVSTMLGITQMVSLIEREKVLCNMNTNEVGEVIYRGSLDNNTLRNTDNLKDGFSLMDVNEKVKGGDSDKHIDKNLLDEDDYLFSSVLSIESAPLLNIDNRPVNKAEDNRRNCSLDMFATTVVNSKFLEGDSTTHHMEETFVPEINKTDCLNGSSLLNNNSVANINSSANRNETNRGICDENFDQVIILSDDEGEENYLVSQKRFCSIKNNSDGELLESRAQNQILIRVDETPKNEKDRFITNSEPIQENTAIEIKISPPNFKRFISNKSRSTSNNDYAIKSPTLLPIKKQETSSSKEGGKTLLKNSKDVYDENWWFDFDFPSKYLSREAELSNRGIILPPKKPKNTIASENILSDNFTKLDSKNNIGCPRKITEYICPARNRKVSNKSSDDSFVTDSELMIDKKIVELKKSNLDHKENSKIEFCKTKESTSSDTIASDVNGFKVNDRNDSAGESEVKIASLREKNVENPKNGTDSIDAVEKKDGFSISESDDSIFKDCPRSLSKERTSSDHKKKRRKKKGCEFIDREVEVESGTSSGEDLSGSDRMDASFIDDQEPSVNIRAEYLRSVRSPVGGRFKIPDCRYHGNIDVYSQYECNDTDYINDSFCVGSEESSAESELSAIEIAERKLKKRKNKSKPDNSKPKRRRIRILSPDRNDSIDEKAMEQKIDSKESPVLLEPAKNKNKKCRILSDSESTNSENSPLLLRKKKYSSKTNKEHSKIIAKKSLDPFFTGKANKYITEDSDQELERAIRASQQEYETYKKNKEEEDNRLQEAIRRSRIDISSDNLAPSTSNYYLNSI